LPRKFGAETAEKQAMQRANPGLRAEITRCAARSRIR